MIFESVVLSEGSKEIHRNTREDMRKGTAHFRPIISESPESCVITISSCDRLGENE